MKDKRLWVVIEGPAYHRYRTTYLKFIRQPVECKKGMFVIQCKDVIDALNALEIIRQMVLNRSLDAQLAQVSGGNRAEFRGWVLMDAGQFDLMANAWSISAWRDMLAVSIPACLTVHHLEH
jgi:hypothetical protein